MATATIETYNGVDHLHMEFDWSEFSDFVNDPAALIDNQGISGISVDNTIPFSLEILVSDEDNMLSSPNVCSGGPIFNGPGLLCACVPIGVLNAKRHIRVYVKRGSKPSNP